MPPTTVTGRITLHSTLSPRSAEKYHIFIREPVRTELFIGLSFRLTVFRIELSLIQLSLYSKSDAKLICNS